MNNKILCVDDEESILKGIRLNLGRSFDITLANGPHEALTLFKEEGPFEGRVQDAGEARPQDEEGAGGRCQLRQGIAGRVPRGHGKEGRGHERLKPDVNDPSPVVREEPLFR